jgi:hypothetical protein
MQYTENYHGQQSVEGRYSHGVQLAAKLVGCWPGAFYLINLESCYDTSIILPILSLMIDRL